ncbi:MAG: sialidase family protein [Thermoanaerobaculia bacterium]
MRRIVLLALGLTLLVPLAGAGGPSSVQAAGDPMTNRFAPSSIWSSEDLATQSAPAAARSAAASTSGTPAALTPSPRTYGCSDVDWNNVRANQECTNVSRLDLLGRGQSQNETAAAVNPTDPRNVLFGQNDYRNGDGSCGFDYSLNGGRTFGDGLIPESFSAPGFTAPRHYWDASGDPVVAFDSAGNAYFACLQFNRGATSDTPSDASGIFVYRSADGGASWTFPGDPVTLAQGTEAEDIGFEDKEWMTVDASTTSAFQDRVYVTWSRFSFDFSSAVIMESHSEDHGVTWSAPQAISGFDADLCPINFSGADPGTCDANQFSNVFTSPNGTVYVAYQNFNNCSPAAGPPCAADPGDLGNHNQILLVQSTDGGVTWTSPVKVADFYDLPDCFAYTGQDFGRSCVPTSPLSDVSIFRATNYPSGAAPTDDEVVIDFGSYINPHSNATLGNCVPAGFSGDTGLNLYDGVGEPNGCNNDILRSVSTDAGATFTGTTTPVDDLEVVSREFHTFADQFWQWSATNPRTGKVLTAFYDRKYGSCLATGCMDISMRLSSGREVRVTNASMPPPNDFAAPNGYSTFFGDYMGLAVGTDGVAHPVWTDSRNPMFGYDPASADPRVPVFSGFGGDIYTAAIRDSGRHH